MRNKKQKILVVDDERSILDALNKVFERAGFFVATAPNGEDALDLLARNSADAVILDISMPGRSGLEVLKEIKRLYLHLPVIMMTGHGTMQTAVESIKLGAYEYITKPLQRDRMLLVVRRALEMARLQSEIIALHARIERSALDHEMVGTDIKMQEVYKKIGVICTTPNTANILIQGESGTGKELVARAIHQNGPHANAPFQAINCTVLPEGLLESELFGHEKGAFTGAEKKKLGKFEVAGEGTILLDEIGDMPESLQKKLLRIIQERTFERLGSNEQVPLAARIVTATHHDLPTAVRKGYFREDLFYRLNVIEVALPPLRERGDDIVILANHFLDKYNQKFGKQIRAILPEALEALSRYDFPGNVRELENLIARAITLERSEFLSILSLPTKVTHGQDARSLDVPILNESFTESRHAVIKAFEKKFITQELLSTNGNVSEAARLAGIERQSFQRLMKKYDLASEDFRKR